MPKPKPLPKPLPDEPIENPSPENPSPDDPAPIEVPNTPTTGGLSTELNLSGMPQVNSYFPTNLFDPSSSPVPRTTADQLQNRLEVAREQKNSIKVATANLENMIELAKLAVKQTKLVRLGVEYRIGLEEIAATNQKLVAAQVATANEGKRVILATEAGRTIDAQIVGQQIKTEIQTLKNENDRLEVNYHKDARPIIEQTWRNKLEVLKEKAVEVLGGGS